MKVLWLFPLFLTSSALAQASDPIAEIPLKAAQFTCSPAMLHDGDTLTVAMSVPHPQELAIRGPDGTYHYLWRPERSTEEILAFANTSHIQLPTGSTPASDLWAVPGELLFASPGWYTIYLSKNLERENSSLTMNECRVHFSGRELSQARPNNSFKPSPHRYCLDLKVGQCGPA